MSESQTGDDAALVWRYDIPLLTNGFILWDLTRVILISVAMMYALVFVTGWIVEGEPVVLPPLVAAITIPIMAVLFGLACLLLGNRHGARFTLTTRGVRYDAESRERKINRAVVIIGALAGSPTTAGAGLIATGQEALYLPFDEIHEVRVYRRPRVIALRNTWRTVLRLHCPPELFDEIAARVDAGWRAAAPSRESEVAERPARAPWPYYAGMTVLIAVLGLFTQAWYWTEPEVAARMGLLGTLFVLGSVLAEGVPRRLAPLLALPLLLWHAGAVVVSALEPVEGIFGTSLVATLDPAELALTACALVALGAIATWRLVAPQR